MTKLYLTQSLDHVITHISSASDNTDEIAALEAQYAARILVVNPNLTADELDDATSDGFFEHETIDGVIAINLYWDS